MLRKAGTTLLGNVAEGGMQWLFMLLVLACIVGFGFSVVDSMPDTAPVILHQGTYSPALLYVLEELGITPEDALITTAGIARSVMRLAPNPKYVEDGCFVGPPRSLVRNWLEKLGVLRSSSRWNKDGTWRW